MKCNRTCDGATFDTSAANYILLEVILTHIHAPGGDPPDNDNDPDPDHDNDPGPASVTGSY